MFDPDLQMRFWRNFSQAMFHSTEAAIAASAEWQKEWLASEPKPAPPPQASFPFWPMALPAAKPQLPVAAANCFNFFAPWAAAPQANPFAVFEQWTTLYRNGMAVWGPDGPCAQWTKTFAPYLPWPTASWAMTQMPLTAMLLSSGMPYSVAAPSAKASTAAMDAAEAARAQMEKAYSAYRSDGGHAAAQLVALPWAIAASMMSSASSRSPSVMQVQ